MPKVLPCTVIHGFAGSVEDVSPLAQLLRLKGYDAKCVALGNCEGLSYRDWIDCAKRALEPLQLTGKKGLLIGFSMGGLITINLAIKYEVPGLILLNTPIYCGNSKRTVLNLVEDVRYGSYSNTKRYVKRAFNLPPFSGLVNFAALLRRTKPLLSQITCPIFIGQSIKDDIVHPKSARHIYRSVSSEKKEIRFYKNSGHLICRSPDLENLFSDVYDFAQKVSPVS